MSTLEVKIKKLGELAVVPQYAKFGDAGLDIVATSKYYDDRGCVCYGTQLAFEIPEGFVGLLFPRSSNAKKDLILSNSVGVIDSGYRGELIFKFKKVLRDIDEDCIHVFNEYKVGDRIGQIVILPYPKVSFVEVNELSNTERGEGGFGSTGTSSIEGGASENDKV